MTSLLSKKLIPMVTIGLALSLLFWSLVLSATGAVKPGWPVLDLTSVRFFGLLLALGLLASLVTSLLERSRSQLCLCLAGLFLLLATMYAYLFQFEGALSLAEGESYEPFPTSFSSGHKGALAPFPQVSFTLTRVEPDGKKGRAVIVQKGVGTEIDGSWREIGSSEIRFKGAALAPLVVVSSKEKGELERSYVKADLNQGEQVFEFPTLPYQFLLRQEKAKGEGKESFHLGVRRGKLSLFEGSADLGQKISVQGVEVSIEDRRKFALLEIRTRRGLVAMQAAAALFAVAALAAMIRIKGGKQG
ncbi:hypothetical protein [Geomonas propionica]|uniref:ResB-like domain-containing protein n=1 Tax=Geomonas propionica TaxID=2798582 RepID=A0ABS0YYA6_9BACT|nr:hypothetical protein [Geomonas propionica]MBJ6802742.1 hypothetical protein [Geomonas propionica]